MSSTLAPGQSASAPADELPEGGGRKKLVMIVLAVVLVAAAAYWFLLRSPAEAAEPVAGEVVALEPIQVNLAGGHYLSVGIALQLTETAHELDGSQALDAAIELYSGRSVEELATTKTRVELKEKLAGTLEESYHGDVMAVYLTQFVTQ